MKMLEATGETEPASPVSDWRVTMRRQGREWEATVRYLGAHIVTWNGAVYRFVSVNVGAKTAVAEFDHMDPDWLR